MMLTNNWKADPDKSIKIELDFDTILELILN